MKEMKEGISCHNPLPNPLPPAGEGANDSLCEYLDRPEA